MATVIEEPSDEQCLRLRLGIAPGRGIAGKDLPGTFEHSPVDQGWMLAGIARLPMVDLAEIHPVLEEIRERPLGERDPADRPAGGQRADPRDDPALAQLPHDGDHRAEGAIKLEDNSDDRRFLFVDHQFAIDDLVTERHNTADPHALLLRRGDLVTDALAGDLAFELGEGEQHVERQPPHAGRGVEGLGDRDEGDAVGVEQLDQFGEVGERTGETVDLVDDDDVDPALPDGLKKSL